MVSLSPNLRDRGDTHKTNTTSLFSGNSSHYSYKHLESIAYDEQYRAATEDEVDLILNFINEQEEADRTRKDLFLRRNHCCCCIPMQAGIRLIGLFVLSIVVLEIWDAVSHF